MAEELSELLAFEMIKTAEIVYIILTLCLNSGSLQIQPLFRVVFLQSLISLSQTFQTKWQVDYCYEFQYKAQRGGFVPRIEARDKTSELNCSL